MKNFGSVLKQLRCQNNLTQAQLASQLSVTKAMVSAYENSTRFPSYDVLIKIARIFHTSTDYLLGLDSAAKIDVSSLTPSQLSLVQQLISEFCAINE